MKNKLIYLIVLGSIAMLCMACGSKRVATDIPEESVQAEQNMDTSAQKVEIENEDEAAPASDFEYKYDAETQGIEITRYLGTSIKVRIPEEIEGELVTCISGAFKNCGIKEVIIPDTVKMIGDETFLGCEGLVNISLPEGLEMIDRSAFQYCDGLTEVIIPDNVTVIGSDAFATCDNLTRVTLPADLEEIRKNTFYSCPNLTDVVMGDNVKYIKEGAFAGCSKLTNINIPENGIEIEHGAFCGDDALTDEIKAFLSQKDEYWYDWTAPAATINE